MCNGGSGILGILVTKQALPETVVQILDAINNFINNPLFVEYESLGLFINGVFSIFILFPPELTAISLVLAGISRFEILITLVTSWIIEAALGYYAGLSGKKLAKSSTIEGEKQKNLEKKMWIIIVGRYTEMIVKFMMIPLALTGIITK